MDYLKIVKRSAQITWKNKYLWLFGFLIGTGGGGNFYSGGGDFSGMNDSDKSVADTGAIFFSEYWIMIVIIGGLILLIGLIFIILSMLAQGGIIGSVDKVDKNKKSGIKDGFKIGWKYFWKVLAVGIVLGLLMIFALGILGVPIVLLFMNEMILRGILLTVLALIIYIPLVVVVSYTSTYAMRFIVLKDEKPIESIRKGFDLLMTNFWKTIVWSLINALVGFVVGLGVLIVLLVVGIPFALLAMLSYAVFSWVGAAIVGGIGILVFLVLTVIINAVVATYKSTGWTLVFKELIKK